MPTPALVLVKRDTSSSSSLDSTSTSCSGKNADLSRCEKPASSNNLEIGLGVAISITVVLLVLSFFVIRNYRKEKREALDHDPDFDETGDPTALPDLPTFSKELNPFRPGSDHVAGNGGYPLTLLQNKSSHDMDCCETHSIPSDSTVDGFILPYQTQVGSKASLDNFARQLGYLNGFNHNRTMSHYSVASINNQRKNNLSENSSPLKSNLNSSLYLNSTSQPGNPQKSKACASTIVPYVTQQNRSVALIIDGSSTKVGFSRSEQLAVKYENKTDSNENVSPESTLTKMEIVSGKACSANVEATDLFSEIVSIHGSEDDLEDGQYGVGLDSPTKSFKSDKTIQSTANTMLKAFGGTKVVAQLINDSNMSTADMTAADLSAPFDEEYLNSVLHQFTDLDDPECLRDESYSDISVNVTQGSHSDRLLSKNEVKAPSMSAFNMLQNVSDNEDYDMAERDSLMIEDQEIQLARLKSVYEVYFDRSNSVKSLADQSGDVSFQADTTQPLPGLKVSKINVNPQLTIDTSEDKRENMENYPEQSSYACASDIYFPSEKGELNRDHSEDYSRGRGDQQYPHSQGYSSENQENNSQYNSQRYPGQYVRSSNNYPQDYGQQFRQNLPLNPQFKTNGENGYPHLLGYKQQIQHYQQSYHFEGESGSAVLQHMVVSSAECV